jgi:hypothetical protein
MRDLAWITSLWPGLAPLWLRGRWSGLGIAMAFAAALNLALVATFAGDRLSATWLGSPAALAALWILVLGFWMVGFRRGQAELSRSSAPATTADQAAIGDQLLRQAQTHYLKGHWIEAETCLSKLLADVPDDAEARLLLASIERRTGRTRQAMKRLGELEHHAPAAGWKWEIQTELARLSGSALEPHPSTSIADLPPAKAA